MGEDGTLEGSFVNVCHCGATWHATSASDACVAQLGSRMEHLTKFREPGVRFESLETQVKSRDKFGELGCNLLF